MDVPNLLVHFWGLITVIIILGGGVGALLALLWKDDPWP